MRQLSLWCDEWSAILSWLGQCIGFLKWVLLIGRVKNFVAELCSMTSSTSLQKTAHHLRGYLYDFTSLPTTSNAAICSAIITSVVDLVQSAPTTCPMTAEGLWDMWLTWSTNIGAIWLLNDVLASVGIEKQCQHVIPEVTENGKV